MLPWRWSLLIFSLWEYGLVSLVIFNKWLSFPAWLGRILLHQTGKNWKGDFFCFLLSNFRWTSSIKLWECIWAQQNDTYEGCKNFWGCLIRWWSHYQAHASPEHACTLWGGASSCDLHLWLQWPHARMGEKGCTVHQAFIQGQNCWVWSDFYIHWCILFWRCKQCSKIFLCATYPQAVCFHGGKHVLSLFFNDLAIFPPIKVSVRNFYLPLFCCFLFYFRISFLKHAGCIICLGQAQVTGSMNRWLDVNRGVLRSRCLRWGFLSISCYHIN